MKYVISYTVHPSLSFPAYHYYYYLFPAGNTFFDKEAIVAHFSPIFFNCTIIKIVLRIR